MSFYAFAVVQLTSGMWWQVTEWLLSNILRQCCGLIFWAQNIHVEFFMFLHEHFDPCTRDHHAVSKCQASTIQWHSTISPNSRDITWGNLDKSKSSILWVYEMAFFFPITVGSLFFQHTHSSVSKQFWQNNSNDRMTVWSLATSQKPTLYLTLSKYFMIKPQDILLSYLCLISQLVLLGSLNVTSLNSTLPTANILLSSDNHLTTEKSTSLSLRIFASELTNYFNKFSTSTLMPVLAIGCSTHWCHNQWWAAF